MAYTSLLHKVPALAYSSDPSALSPCHLVIKYSASLKQAAIFLHALTHVHGSENAQSFVLMYQADNFSSIFIQPATEPLSQNQLSEIARRKNSAAAKTLHLTLYTPCLVMCPSSVGSFAPKPGHETSFRQLRNLASATTANIVFDDNWIHEQHYGAFWRLTTHPERLAGLPANGHHASRQADWTVFVPAEDVDQAITEEAEPEAPPRYTKAPAEHSATSSPCTPPRKRKRNSSPFTRPPTARPPVLLAPPGSPTEKATTTTASPSPQPSSPSPRHTPDIQQMVANAIESLLPVALEKRIATIAERQLGEIHFDAKRDAVGALEEAADDHKAELEQTKTNAITELQDESEVQLDKFAGVAAEVVAQMRQEMESHADDVYLEVYDSISALVSVKECISFKAMRRLLARERRIFGKARARAARRRDSDEGGGVV